MSAAVRTRRSPRDVLIIAAISGTILLMFPLLALTGLALQFGFVLALPLVLLALLLAPVIGRFVTPREPVEVQGILLPGDVYLHERHAWARRAGGGRYRVGADALLLNALSEVDALSLPDAGETVEQGAALVTLRSGERELTLKAPFAGTVKRVNSKLSNRLSALQDSPYEGGWLVELAPAAGVRSLDGLRHSATARPWLTHEIDRMLKLITEPDQTTVLADGATLERGYADSLDDGAWSRLERELF